jgi:hypothetical protein
MRLTRLPLAFAGLLFSLSAAAQSVPEATHRGIPGYLDAHTGRFTSLAATRAHGSALSSNAVVSVSAGIKVTGTITVASAAITSNATITCSVSLELLAGDGGDEVYIEEAQGVATRSGNTATCTVTTPFLWKLPNPADDIVGVSVVVDAEDPGTGFARNSSLSLSDVAVPAGGTTAAMTFSSRI